MAKSQQASTPSTAAMAANLPTDQDILAMSPSKPTEAMQQQATRGAPNEAANKLIDSIDDFLNDIQKKFTTVSEEILGKLDDMAERCDRLEQEMLLGLSNSATPQAGTAGNSGGQGNSNTGSLNGDSNNDNNVTIRD